MSTYAPACRYFMFSRTLPTHVLRLQLKKRALLPTDHTYSSMFGACGAAGPGGAAVLDKVRAEMERRNVCANTIVNNAMISALALCGRVEEAMQAYVDMAKTHSEPDLCTFGALLLTVGKDKTRGMGVARRVWSEMTASKLSPDLHSYNMMLQVLRDAGLEGVVDEEGRVLNAYGKLLKRTIPHVDTETLWGVGGVSVEEERKKERSDGVKRELYVRGRVEFELSEGRVLVLHVGSLKQDGPLTTRWLEQHSIETLFSALKQSRLKPDIRTFQLLMHLTLDPAHLLVTMRERKVAADSKLMVAAVTQQATHFHSLQGAKVILS